MLKVKDWMVDLLVFVDPDTTVLEALQLMRRRYIHSLLVNKTSAHPNYGIITSTDICDRIIAEERNPAKIKVHEIMTSPILTIQEDQSLVECVKFMKEKHIHHMPVANSKNELVGFISPTDMLFVAESLGKS